MCSHCFAHNGEQTLQDDLEEERRRRQLVIQLTGEQARLYNESAMFKNLIDSLVEGVIPIFIEGAAAQAARVDATVRARQHTERMWDGRL